MSLDIGKSRGLKVAAAAASTSIFALIGTQVFAPERNEPIEATAAATLRSDGVEIQSPTPEEIGKLHSIRSSIANIDKRYPPPDRIPHSAKLYQAKEIESDGRLVLRDGPEIKIDGIRCTPDGLRRMSKVLLDGASRVAYQPATTKLTNPILVDIWLVDISMEIENRPAFSYSFIADTAVMSGWCVPELAASSARYERYVALSRLVGR